MIVVEDHAVTGGFGSAVLEVAARKGIWAANVRLMGLPDRFIAHAKRQEQLAQVGLDAEHIAAAAEQMFQATAAQATRHADRASG